MGIEIDALALENWYDLFAFLSRSQLGQFASSIGNRRFSTIVQGFLHKYVRQITLRSINLTQTTNENAKDHPKARVNLWQKYRWGQEEFPVADWAMPENIINFEAIQLSYLDFSVMRFLQIYQQNALFTNVNLHIRMAQTYSQNDLKMARLLSHLIPLIAGIDSIEFKGSKLIDLIIYQDSKHHRYIYYPKEEMVAYSKMMKSMLNQARFIEISNRCGRHQFDWLCHWLYTPRDDGKAKCLLLLGEYISPYDLASVVERVKEDFLMAKQAVSYFIGIQFEHRDRPSFIPYIPLETLTNSRTNEQMTCKKGQLLNPQLRPNEPALVLISRHPLDAAQEWIDANEKELMERKNSTKESKDRIGWIPLCHWANETS